MNKILLKGRLTADPEMKTINDGANFVTKFSIAVNRKYVKEYIDTYENFLIVETNIDYIFNKVRI